MKALHGKVNGGAAVGLLLAALALLAGIWLAWRAIRFFLSEVRREAAIVKDTRLIERRNKGRTYYSFRVTIETANDQRELKTDRGTWNVARTGACVLAFTRDDYLLEMAPLDA
jgi:hypothetical protein